MRLLILSEIISGKQRYVESAFSPPHDVQIDTDYLNNNYFTSSVFDYDISIIHISKPSYSTTGYYENLPKLFRDSSIALEHGRALICLPDSENFVSENSHNKGMSAYEWLKKFGIELQDNVGEDIKPTGAGRAQIIQEYLKYTPKYYQIVNKPISEPTNRLAIVGDTEIVVGLEHRVKKGILVILPPPVLDEDNYNIVMSKLLGIAHRYYDRAQRNIVVGDTPSWLSDYLVTRHNALEGKISKLIEEKVRYDRLAYALYGTGKELETSVTLLLNEIGLEVESQPPGANIDLKAKHPRLDFGFAVEVTGTKDLIRKDSNKVAQAWTYLHDRVGTSDENDRLLIIANTQCHLDPRDRDQEGYTPDIVRLLGENNILMLTTLQLYEQWKAVHEKHKSSDDLVRELYGSSGLYGKSSSA